MNNSELFSKALTIMPGGVNSPVRAFKSVGMEPKFIAKSEGAYLYDVEGNQYLDYVCSWGPMILGHNNPEVLKAIVETAQNGISFGAPTALEVAMAEKMIQMVPDLEMVRMVNSGTEAVMSAIRLARGVTEKDKIIKFEGCYHGHSDSMLVKAGSGALTQGVPDSGGIPKELASLTLTAQYNQIETVAALFKANKNEIACVIVEPVAANMGVVVPNGGFLSQLKALCEENNALLIFDEVITGFRLAAGGAQQFFNVQADIVTYGKIIGGGMPVGAYGGSKKIMERIAPCGNVYQAGTLSGNPVAMAAGLKQLEILDQSPEIYDKINRQAKKLADGMENLINQSGIKACVNGVGSLCCIYFGVEKVDCYEEAKKADVAMFAKFFKGMMERKINLAPSQFEAMFVSDAHDDHLIEYTLESAEYVLNRKGSLSRKFK